MERTGRYRQLAVTIASYLAARQQPDGSLPGPDHYGLAFCVWLWSRLHADAQAVPPALRDSFASAAERSWRRLADRPPRTHGEFNAYALLSCRRELGPEPTRAVLRHIRYGRRHSANWMLLRAVCRARQSSGLRRLAGGVEAASALLRCARRGFIADRPGVRSFAYHAFCGALLADLWGQTRWRWAGEAAVRAAQFISPFVLPNGDTLYVGRGQQQVFGYAALLYLLEAAALLTGRDDFRSQADLVLARLLGFQRPDGSLPLVLRPEEPPEPWSPADLPGWYSYNRYADYLPFLGCFLLKAAEPEVPPLGDVAPLAPHPDFRVHRLQRYVAVLSRPGGASTNDLAFPYVCLDGVSIFPCYGAEGNPAPEAAPLPYGVLQDGRPYPFRDRLSYRLTESRLSGASGLAVHVRRFDFGPRGFLCRDEIEFRRACSFSRFVVANFLLGNINPRPDGWFETRADGASALLRLSLPAEIRPRAAVSASGPLVALRHEREALRARPGDTLAVELEVRFP